MASFHDALDLQGFHLLLAGGGSGGHVFPGLAVGDEIVRRGGTVSFVGSAHGMEARLVRARDVDFHALPARPVVGRGPVAKLRALITTASSTLRARSLVRRIKPSMVLATGGYVSVAPALGARLAGRPLVLLEPNANSGAANRMLARFARGACVAWPDVGLRCPTWDTGVPVRRAFFEHLSSPASAPLRILVLGGSQGSQQLNDLVPAALSVAASRLPSLRVLHQAGERHADLTRSAYEAVNLGGTEVTVVPFVADVAAEMAESHLVISRSGAITLAELCAAGRASLLLPLALAGDHQRANAEALERAGAARVLAADEATPGAMAVALEGLLVEGRWQEMGEAARRLARPKAAEAIVERLLEVAA
ncbi:MAG: UDP-N-acetylglucosamine--N-acetylmuramyl-(pentapeptide) pyrophosphoryl-undecaprenol N-acetylglucosamine transferase [Thermoanaerobaculia bacterium]|nr:UDP-N-acetylglucosamine--N-acetylmuramyl-(pentapeptide) pyrophosphoryl-undecaprenol N-acetylglucosamine transferase [Thermoanaerobaculia bacterium]